MTEPAGSTAAAGWMTRWAAVRMRSAVFIGCAVLAVAVGFVLVPPRMAEPFIVKGGYYYVFTVFAAWVFFLGRALRAGGRETEVAPSMDRGAWLAVLGATVFAVWADDFKHKILFDEYVLQGTAWHMHATKEVSTPIRAYDFSGTWLAIDTFLDKRPYFFTFLLSLVHDLTGFRIQNVYALNVVLAALTLGLTYWLVHQLTQRRVAAIVAVAALATLPLFGQNATGAGMELHNLSMIAAVAACGTLYLKRPDNDRLSALVLGTVLLAQSRYESVLFVGPVAVLIVLGWRRAGRIVLPWPALVAPLLLVPYAWHDRIVDSKMVLWQLREGETARFAWQFVAGNVEGARNFFFAISRGQPNSIALTVLGLIGVLAAARSAVRWWRLPPVARPPLNPVTIVIALLGVAIVGNVGLLMFYYWSRFDEPIAARFSLPAYFLLAIAAGAWAAHGRLGRWPGWRIASGVLLAWLVTVALPGYSRRTYTTHNLVMHEVDWELERVRARPGPVLLITSKATMPFLLHRIPTVNTASIRARGEQVAWHMRHGTFREVVVAQVVRPLSADGPGGIDPEDVLPPEFRLEPWEQKRFGGRWIRLSRLVEITSPPSAGIGAVGREGALAAGRHD